MAEDSAAPGPAWAAAEGNPMGEPAGTAQTGAAETETAAVLGGMDEIGRGGAGLGRTGDERVDEAVARLDELADMPLEEHPAIFEQIHDRLREVLGEVSPGRPGSP